MERIGFWIITFEDVSAIEEMVDKISQVTSFTPVISILDNTDKNDEPLKKLKEIEAKYREKGIDITIYSEGKNLMWSGGMSYLDRTTEFTKYVIYLCSKHIKIMDITGFDDMIEALKNNPKAGQSGRISRCAGLYYFKSVNAPYAPPPGKETWTFPRFLPKLEGKFSRQEIFKGNRIYMHIQGGLFAFDRQILRDIDGYEEELKHYFADLEMGVRLQCYGYELVNVPTIWSAQTNIEPMPQGEFKILHVYENQGVNPPPGPGQRPIQRQIIPAEAKI